MMLLKCFRNRNYSGNGIIAYSWINQFPNMSIAVIYPHIEKPPGAPARLARVKRVRVAQLVMDYLAYGWSPEEMCRQHPYLTIAEAHAAMLYYWDHADEIEQELQQEQAQQEIDLKQGHQSPFFKRMKAKGLL
jgi:uncharacterized protein (DUF433 family)